MYFAAERPQLIKAAEFVLLESGGKTDLMSSGQLAQQLEYIPAAGVVGFFLG